MSSSIDCHETAEHYLYKLVHGNIAVLFREIKIGLRLIAFRGDVTANDSRILLSSATFLENHF
jgi:hypothetical protein